MLTFDGKSASFVPGKEVTNKEPAVSKFVVEKLYQVHRERIANMEPVVECRVDIPDFLTNNSWKQITELHKKEVIRKENEVIYQRIAKVENLESSITKASREHKKRVETELVLMKNLKLKGRIRDFLKVQRENEDMLKRIERARPEYTLKGCREWYKHHELFKQGRRSDPCGGHLGFRVPKKLMPKRMQPLTSSLDNTLSNSVFNDENIVGGVPVDPRSSRGNTSNGRRRESINSKHNKLARSVLSVRAQTANGAALTHDNYLDNNSMFDLQETLNMGSVASTATGDDSLYKQMFHIGKETSNAQRPATKNGNTGGGRIKKVAHADQTNNDEGESNEVKKGSVVIDTAGSLDAGGSLDTTGSKFSKVDQGDKGSSVDYANSEFEDGSQMSVCAEVLNLKREGYHVLLSRPYTIPFAHTVIIQLLSKASGFSEDVCIRVLTMGGETEQELVERWVPIDNIFDVVSSTSSRNLLQSANNDDLSSLRTLLVTMFQEADDDGNGYLTYDEFELLMDNVELGISHSELRSVIQEADENENGVVEFDEFVPLAVDLIQSFRCLTRAKIYCSSRDAMYEEEVNQKMETIDFDDITTICMRKITECDPKKYGVMRLQEFRRCLSSIAYAAELNESEISRIIYMLPVDPFGRVLYNGLNDVLKKVKFHALKSEVLRAQGSNLQRELYDSCRKAEQSVLTQNDGAVGRITTEALISVMKSCGQNLSRLQICVLLAGSVVDSEVDYHQFVPVAAKAIEYMFEPKALRQRAEVINTTDLSSENLMTALNEGTEELTSKVSGLFHACDVNNSGSLNIEEFVLVMKSLEFELTDEEIEAYFYVVPLSHDNEITLETIVGFLMENLPILQRKKQNRKLAAQLHSGSMQNLASAGDKEAMKEQSEELTKRLKSIFELSDEENTGFLTLDEFKKILHSLNLGIPAMELDLILAEADRQDGDEDGLIDYLSFLPDCVELLKTFMAKEIAFGDASNNEKKAYDKAEAIAKASRAEIIQIASYLRSRLAIIDQALHFESERFKAVNELVHNPHSGLTRTEGSALITNLFAADNETGSDAKGASSPKSFDEKKEGTTYENENNSIKHDTSKAFSPKSRDFDGIAFAVSEGKDSKESENEAKNTLLKLGGAAGDGKSKTAKRALKMSLKKVMKSSKIKIKPLTKTLNELIDIVHACRRTSIMRGILNEISPTACTNLILAHIEYIREDMITANLLDANSIYVPVKVCYQALQNANDLRLHRSQILSIVSWADCYDKTGQLLDYKRFSEHAAKVIMKLFDEDHLSNRALVLQQDAEKEKNQTREDMNSAMNGLIQSDLEFFLKQTFESMVAIDSRELTQDQCIQALLEIPLVKLSDKEAASVAASCTSSNMTVNADEMVIHAYDIISSICRERFVNRRVAMMALSNNKSDNADEAKQNESFEDLRKLAENFIDFVKVQQIEKKDEPGIHHYQIVLSTETKDRAEVVDDQPEELNIMSDPEVVLISGQSIELPVVEVPAVIDTKNVGLKGAAAVAIANAAAKAALIRKQNNNLPKTFSGIIKVVATEIHLAMDREISITITSADSKVVAKTDTGSIKLPMLCAIEKELAEEFAQSLLSRLVVQMKTSDDTNPVVLAPPDKVGGMEKEINFGHFFEY